MRTAVLLLAAFLPAFAADILIVADEIPAMQVLASKLPRPSEIVTQDQMPDALGAYKTIVVYIHKDITPVAEHAFIDYANQGGNLVLLHHSISSGKRKNKDWLPFLGVTLPDKPFAQGGYKYIDPARWEIVNLAPENPVTKGVSRIEVEDSEIYLNHVLSGDRTTLLGIRFTDPKTGRLYEQPTAGWHKKTGRGGVFYFMPGHRASDFENPVYARVLANAVR
jgi:type 1 glutamine amidotransferase